MKMPQVKKTRKMLQLEERLGEDLGVYLRREYEENRKNLKEISLEIGAGSNTITRYLKEYEIRVRNLSEAQLPEDVNLSKEELEKLYIDERKSLKKIAKEKNVSESTITNRIKGFGIRIRSKEDYLMLRKVKKASKEELKEMYIDRHMGCNEIAKELGCSPAAAYRWVKGAGIQLRDASESKLKEGVKKPTKEELKQWYVVEQMSSTSIAKKVGVSNPTILQQLRDYKISIRDNSDCHRLDPSIKIDKEKIINWYREGKTTVEIGKMVGLSHGSVGDLLRKEGIRVRGSWEYRLPKDFVPPTKEKLEELYIRQRKNASQIGAELGGVSDVYILSLLKEYSLPIRSSLEARLPPDFVKPTKEELEQLYVIEGRRPKEIGEMFGVSSSAVFDWLREKNIPIRDRTLAHLPPGVKKPTKEELEQWYTVEQMSFTQIAKKVGVTPRSVINWLEGNNIPLRAFRRIASCQQFVEFIKGDATARNLAAVAARLNGQAGDAEKIITEIYEGRFKDRGELHDYIQGSREEIESLVREGVTNLGPYLGDFTLHERDIFPVLMGEIIANVSEGTITSLEERFMRLLRHDYGAKFNAEPEKTLAEISEKKEAMEGRRKDLYGKLEEHYRGVLKLKEELSN
jgi:transposase